MTAARDEVLKRVRGALPSRPAAAEPAAAILRQYRQHGDFDRLQTLELFAERLRDYHATVEAVGRQDVAAAVDRICSMACLERLAVPPGLPARWRPREGHVIDDEGLTAHDLDALDGALTGCAVAIAETGTIILDGQRLSGRRILTLVPDHHICIVRSDQIVQLVPEALAVVGPSVQQHGVPITLISGPSATSDIELSRVEGVHGPRHLHVLIVEERRHESS
jgi:L-lactate dehydrogenase complex protein LldG